MSMEKIEELRELAYFSFDLVDFVFKCLSKKARWVCLILN